MKNKLLLSTLVIASTINLSKVSASQTVIDYPIDVVAGATLNLPNANGYTVTEPISINNANKEVISPITYNASFSAEGSATLSFADVTFNNDLTLTPTGDSAPMMTVSGNMKIAGTGTINTGGIIISFSGDNPELDISDAYGVTFTRFDATGRDAAHKVMINYGDTETVRAAYDNYRDNLRSVLTDMILPNTKIQDIWVTGGVKSIDEGYILEHNSLDDNPQGDKFSIRVRHIYDDHGGGTEGTKFIGSDDSLPTMLANRGVEVIAPDEENDMDEDKGIKYELDFGRDINSSIPGVDKGMLYNSEGNVFTGWEDIEYDLDSNPDSERAEFTFNMDIKPESFEPLKLKSSNPDLVALTLNGEQNDVLTIALKSAGIREVAFSPLKASYCIIDASAAIDKTKDSDNLHIGVLDHNPGPDDIVITKPFYINRAPIVTAYGLTDGEGNMLDGSGQKTSDPDEQYVVYQTYSLHVGKNVNAVLTSDSFHFNNITVDISSRSTSKITVSGSDTILNL